MPDIACGTVVRLLEDIKVIANLYNSVQISIVMDHG